MTMNAIAIAIGAPNPASWIPVPGFFVPLADAGAGAVNTTLGAGTGSATFTRATTAWAKLASGLWTSVASGVARSHYLGTSTAVGAYGGYLAEETRTNECLQARDFSNASWVKTTMTGAKDQVGIDGVANAASSLLATGAGATVTQAITSASNITRTFSIFVKRITGTGAVSLSLNNSTFTDISGSINSATYTRVGVSLTVANPTVAINLATSGDKIAVDMAQEEVGTFATSPIPTTTVAVARNTDVLTYPVSGNILGTVGTAACEITSATNAGLSPAILSTFTGTGGAPMQVQDVSSDLGFFDGTSGRASTTVLPLQAVSVTKVATNWGGSSGKAFVNGSGSAVSGFDGDMSLNANLAIGGHVSVVGSGLYGTIKNVKIWTRVLLDAQIAAL